ncbi:hypothetical protein PSECIP111951_02407 [Pseudoalteromonas holothuriae]|uniref:Uncharacterized protein n=1 Tax=Pseudoalteromonas holothuriae TaxID=2963714 RepID=A0ABN8UMA2_9GAMM|nr:EAL domain-containing protein [Pseudoalteromonas sp. CIP111951]CAH9061056.1 hypothetical protein PSECIP111951_02407 [Pseudoalteromonas sp. CIP111951]
MKHLFFWVLGYLAIVIALLFQLPSELTIISLSGVSVWLLGAMINQAFSIRAAICFIVSLIICVALFFLPINYYLASVLIFLNLIAVLLLSELLVNKCNFDVTLSSVKKIAIQITQFTILPSLCFGVLSCVIASMYTSFSFSFLLAVWVVTNTLGLLIGTPFILLYQARGDVYLQEVYKFRHILLCFVMISLMAMTALLSWSIFTITVVALLALSAVLYSFKLLSLVGYILGGSAGIVLYANRHLFNDDLLNLGFALFVTLISGYCIALILWRYKKITDNSCMRLKQLNINFEHTFELSPEMLLTLNSDGVILEVSEGFLSAIQISRLHIIGRRLDSFISDKDKQSFLSHQLNYAHKFKLDALTLVDKYGKNLIVNFKAQVFEFEQGHSTLCFLQDISEQIKLADVLEQEKELLEVTLSSIGDGVICTDVNGKVTYMNPVAEAILAKLTREVEGVSFDEVMPLYNEDTKQPIRGLIEQCIKNNQLMGLPELTCVRNHLQLEFAVQDSISPIYLKNGEIVGAVMVFQDVSESRLMSRKLNHMAHHDVLTGLPNRLLLQDRLSQFCKRAKRESHKFAVAFVDLDKFKKINDSLGHDVGDLLLKQVASRFTRSVRACDTVSRMGGDEFVLLLDKTKDKHQVAKVVKKILNCVSGGYELDSVHVELSVSAGIAIYPQDGDCAESLMKHADTAMYRAKKVSKSDYEFYSIELDQAAELRIAQEAAIVNGVQENEFIPYYQPVVNAQSYSLEKLEMLARWHHKGVLQSPDSFINIAEEANLIEKVSNQLLNQAFSDFSGWIKKMPTLILSVNISVLQLVEPKFVKAFTTFLKEYSIPPNNIEIEITESSLVSNIEAMKQTLFEVQQCGIKVAIDDFGTGYSSLSYLKYLNFDTIKVDQKFVAELTQGRTKGELAIVIVNMAKSLHVNCVAEGVETAEQATKLAQAGCQQLQGYYFSRPKSAQDIDPIIKVDQSISQSRTIG